MCEVADIVSDIVETDSLRDRLQPNINRSTTVIYISARRLITRKCHFSGQMQFIH